MNTASGRGVRLNRVRTAWAAPSRRYHDVLHLVECLETLDRFASQAGVTGTSQDTVELALWFHERTPVSPDAITALLRQEKGKYRFTPEFRLYARLADASFDGVLSAARNLLKCLV